MVVFFTPHTVSFLSLGPEPAPSDDIKTLILKTIHISKENIEV